MSGTPIRQPHEPGAGSGALRRSDTTSGRVPARAHARSSGRARLCQTCGADLTLSLIDLGYAPLASAFLPSGPPDCGDSALLRSGQAVPQTEPEAAPLRPETRYPLHARVCPSCWLVQTDPVLTPRELFPPDHLCLSSISDTRLADAQTFVGELAATYGLQPGDLVVEIGSNDGYLLRWFRARGQSVLGIDPSARAGLCAAAQGVPTLSEFFDAACGERLGARLHREGRAPRLIVALNVLTHIPDLVGALRGTAALLAHDGVLVAQVPHLTFVLSQGRFDLIRHETFTCPSLLALVHAASCAGLRIVEADIMGAERQTLRIVAARADSDRPEGASVATLLAAERAAGLDRAETYAGFTARAEAIRAGLIEFLTLAQDAGQRVVAYGAAARGSALLNYCAIGPDLIAACADRNPAKQGSLMPGSRIPVVSPSALRDMRPDVVLILPWNLRSEILDQSADLQAAGTRFVVATPDLSFVA